MSDQHDFAALAREYLDLWEDQLAALAADPALAAQSTRFFEALGQAEAAANPLATAQMAAMAQRFMSLAGLAAADNADHGEVTDEPTSSTPARTASAAAASGDSAQQLAELTSRLTALEERLDRLEAGIGRTRRSPKPAPSKGHSASTRNRGAKRKQSKPKSA